MALPFWKYVGAGNDFIIFDNRHSLLHFSKEDVQQLCHRSFGIGADGILLVENSSCADYKMHIFNSDGSEPEMCGNGLRCFGRYLADQELAASQFTVEVVGKVLEVTITDLGITIEMGSPTNISLNLLLNVGNREYKLHSLNTGVPHAVLFVDDALNFPLQEWAPSIRFHSAFGKSGTNVNIATLQEGNKIALRTYERGVEGETLACGTGAVAAAIAAHYQFNLSSPLQVVVKSGETLTVNYEKDKNAIARTCLTGNAKQVFFGILEREG